MNTFYKINKTKFILNKIQNLYFINYFHQKNNTERV